MISAEVKYPSENQSANRIDDVICAWLCLCVVIISIAVSVVVLSCAVLCCVVLCRCAAVMCCVVLRVVLRIPASRFR